MALPSFARDTITVRRAPVIEDRGASIHDWSNYEEHEITGCSVQFRSTSFNGILSSNSAPRESYMVRATLFAPPDADLKAADRVIFKGVEYLVEGSPYVIVSPTGRVSHTICFITEWEG
jgi:hypothetical protein